MDQRQLNPHLRDLVIASVGLMVAAGLLALSLLGRSVTGFVWLSLASAVVTVVVGGYVFVQAWRWSQHLAGRGRHGRSVLVAIAGGSMILLAAAAMAAGIWVILLFFLG